MVVLAIAVGGYVALHRAKPYLVAPGCEARVSGQAVSLDPEQAAIAGTIGGVAHRLRMPEGAVTVAYATAMQESHLHNLTHGDLDSVGVFQQRPSQGWGSAQQLADPVYATTKFFRALAGIHGYLRMPVHTAAQRVQHSADGAAYQQYEQFAVLMAQAFTGRSSGAAWCWYPPPKTVTPDLPAAERDLTRTFGRLTVSHPRGDPGGQAAQPVSVHVPNLAAGWSVAAWSVAHAEAYGISTVAYAGYQWQAANGIGGWQQVTGASTPPGDRVELS